MVRQLAYSTELLVCINHSKKQYKQRRRRKLFSTQLYSLKLSLLLSLLFCSLCVFHSSHLRSSHSNSPTLHWAYIYIKLEVKGINHAMIYAHRLCPPPCAKWEIRYSHLHMVGHCLSPLTNTSYIHSCYELGELSCIDEMLWNWLANFEALKLFRSS